MPSVRQRIIAGLTVKAVWLVCPAIATAQQATATAPAEKSHVLPYVLIGFLVALGMMIYQQTDYQPENGFSR